MSWTITVALAAVAVLRATALHRILVVIGKFMSIAYSQLTFAHAKGQWSMSSIFYIGRIIIGKITCFSDNLQYY